MEPTRKIIVASALTILVVLALGVVGLRGRDSATPSTTAATSIPVTSSTLPTPEPVPAAGAVDKYEKLGVIEIPAIQVKANLLRGITLKTFDRGVGWWPGTAVPGGYGNMVMGGHRTTSPKPFRHLELLKPGDEIVITTDAARFVYVVRTTRIVDDSALWIVDQAPGFTATLFACHPVGSTAQRIVVFGDLRQGTN